jgi:jouberin
MRVGDKDVVVRWGRLPGQPCAITDMVTTALSVGRGGCSFACFSPSGRYLSIAGNNENNRFSLYIYKVLEWKLLSVLPTDDGIIYDISWTNDEQTIVIASSSGLCYVSDGACTDGILPHPSYVYCCRWVELDGRVPMVVTGCYDGTLRLWKRNQVCHTHSLTNNSHVIKMAYDKRQCVLYTVTNDSTISSWSINDRDKLELIKHVNLKDLERCQIRHFDPLPWSNQFLINAPRSPTPLSIIDLRIGSIKIKMSPVSDTITTSCVSSCGNYIIGISQSSIVYFWNSSNGELMKQFKCHYLHSPAIFCLYHPFDHLLVCGGLGFDQRTLILSNK